MWPFNKPKSLKESGMLTGFTDWHSHILPGVDDGVPTMEKSLELLAAYEELGFRKVWLTPHIMEDYPNTTESLKNRFEELKQAWKGNIELALAAENMLDNLFEERLENNDLLTLGNSGNHVLVETSYFNPPMDLDNIFERILAAGYFPVLAHPERYQYMTRKDYSHIREKGVMFQLNLASIVGGFGNTARKKAEWLLDNNMIDLTGSDVHRLSTVYQFIEKRPDKKKYLDKIMEIAANPAIV